MFKQTNISHVRRKEIKNCKKLLYSFKRSFQLGNKKFRVIYTLSLNQIYIKPILKESKLHIYVTMMEEKMQGLKRNLEIFKRKNV